MSATPEEVQVQADIDAQTADALAGTPVPEFAEVAAPADQAVADASTETTDTSVAADQSAPAADSTAVAADNTIPVTEDGAYVLDASAPVEQVAEASSDVADVTTDAPAEADAVEQIVETVAPYAIVDESPFVPAAEEAAPAPESTDAVAPVADDQETAEVETAGIFSFEEPVAEEVSAPVEGVDSFTPAETVEQPVEAPVDVEQAPAIAESAVDSVDTTGDNSGVAVVSETPATDAPVADSETVGAEVVEQPVETANVEVDQPLSADTASVDSGDASAPVAETVDVSAEPVAGDAQVPVDTAAPVDAGTETAVAADATDDLILDELPVGIPAPDQVDAVEVATDVAEAVAGSQAASATVVEGNVDDLNGADNAGVIPTVHDLHHSAQLILPTTAGNPPRPINNMTLESTDSSVATVDENGVVTRVPGTTGTEVTVIFRGEVVGENDLIQPVYGEVKYNVVHDAPIALALESQDQG